MATKQYRARYHLKHDGKRYAPGDLVTLDEKIGDALQSLEPVGKSKDKPAAESKDKPAAGKGKGDKP